MPQEKFTRNSPDYEMWAHAACLTLAEGNKDYPPEELQSPAMKAVIKVVQERDALKIENDQLGGYSAFLNSCAASGEQPETFEWYIHRNDKR